jgi:hypothetical protein
MHETWHVRFSLTGCVADTGCLTNASNLHKIPITLARHRESNFPGQ